MATGGVRAVNLGMFLLVALLAVSSWGSIATAETDHATLCLLEGGSAGRVGGGIHSAPPADGEQGGSEQEGNTPEGALRGGEQLQPEQNGAACGGRALYDACFVRVAGQWMQGQCLWQQGGLICVLPGSGGESSGGRVQ